VFLVAVHLADKYILYDQMAVADIVISPKSYFHAFLGQIASL
jgi:hypothetical protein